MSSNTSRAIVEDFLRSSWPCVEATVKELATFRGNPDAKISLFLFKKGQKKNIVLDGTHFFLRTSVEYSNPQLTVEEAQGIIAARLLEVCGNHFNHYGLHEVEREDVDEICEALTKPSSGMAFPFLLNTDEIEPDRYSMNPLRESIVNSGQSAFACSSVKTDALKIDQDFAQKYDGSLITKSEIDLIARHLKACRSSYVDMVDAAKYEQLENLSEALGINLDVHSIRMPLEVLEKENIDGILHRIIKGVHVDYQAIERVYNCMGRSMKNLTTLLTIPHSGKGYASKRTVRGRIHFEGTRLKGVKVDYRTTLLYPNDIDPGDISVARANDSFNVEGGKLVNYIYKETPSSPQFSLYSLASPENAVLWHGIGAFGASELLKSYTTTRQAYSEGSLIGDLPEKHGIGPQITLQFNLTPKYMWVHPIYRNIDASVGCIGNLKDLVGFGMKVERLPTEQYVRDWRMPEN